MFPFQRLLTCYALPRLRFSFTRENGAYGVCADSYLSFSCRSEPNDLTHVLILFSAFGPLCKLFLQRAVTGKGNGQDTITVRIEKRLLGGGVGQVFNLP